MKVLFVCTGNICRSPVAQRMLEHIAVQQELNIVVASAGTRALNGRPMHPESIRVLEERGITGDGFKSQFLTAGLVREFDVVLGMTREHRAVARQLAPARWRRMFALHEVVGSFEDERPSTRDSSAAVDPTDVRLDIPDPMGQSGDVFDRVAIEIDAAVSGLTGWIENQFRMGDSNHQVAR